MTYKLKIATECWPLKEPFRISRGVKTEAVVVIVSIEKNGLSGRGEATPYARYNETPESVTAQIESIRIKVESGISRDDLSHALPAGSARNAVDCALWDLSAKEEGISVASTLDQANPENIITAVTVPIDTPERMGAKAVSLANCPLLKVKLGNENILESVRAVRNGAPKADIIIDPNESWTIEHLKSVDAALADLGVVMLEQPLAADSDGTLLNYANIIPICADEACHTKDSLKHLKGRYQIINIKLDKTGGLTGALDLLEAAQQDGFDIMIGCMVSTSLAMAPALMIAQQAKFVDLDGPVWIKKDRPHGLEINNGVIENLPKKLWGSP